MTCNIAILTGTTASGKTAHALRVAAVRPTLIINADAMQMYAELRILSARPTLEEEAQAEHALYGVLPAKENGSVAKWLALVLPLIQRARDEDKLPLLVGGTGMYLKALMEGINDIPAVPTEIRERVRAMPDAYEALCVRDPLMAARLKAGDTQRVLRALEVFETTGESLASFQEKPMIPPLPEATFHVFYAQMAREEVYRRIDARFEKMMAEGALEEVQQLMQQDVPDSLPLMRAHGVPELVQYLRGGMTREDAIAKGQQNTRNYAKRQMTWLRHQLPAARPLTADNTQEFDDLLMRLGA